MKRLFNILSCLLLLSILYPSLCLPNPCSQALIRAMKEEGITDQQIELICKKAELYQEFATDEPTNPYAKACILFEQNKYRDAISELESFCQDNPSNVKGKILLAKAYLEECFIFTVYDFMETAGRRWTFEKIGDLLNEKKVRFSIIAKLVLF